MKPKAGGYYAMRARSCAAPATVRALTWLIGRSDPRLPSASPIAGPRPIGLLKFVFMLQRRRQDTRPETYRYILGGDPKPLELARRESAPALVGDVKQLETRGGSHPEDPTFQPDQWAYIISSSARLARG
jgi:hypothetical protein